MPGPSRRSRTHKAQRDVHRAARTRARTRDIDQIQLEDLTIPGRREQLQNQAIAEDLPGLGQHYCVECARYFETGGALESHTKTKVHKRRVRLLKEPAYTQEEADRAAGLGVDKKQRGPAAKMEAES